MNDFSTLYFQNLALVMTMMTVLWIASVLLKNVSIVDMFWGFGFVVSAFFYYAQLQNPNGLSLLLLILVSIWGMRLSIYLGWRNIGKPEDFRYQEFRKKYGEKRYWWISFFQTFVLQGILIWLISAPILGAMINQSNQLNILHYLAILLWLIGVLFEALGDFQLLRFKKNPLNKGKVLDTGLWKYTRHPNYFGDSAVWWSYGIFCIAAGSYIPVLGSLLMTALIIKVSGVALLEKSLKENKPEYQEYIRKTSSFIPWFPKKN